MRVCSHRKANRVVFNTLDELLRVREDAFVCYVETDEGPLRTSEGCTATEREEEPVLNFVAQIATQVSKRAERVLRNEQDSLLTNIHSE